MALTKIPSSLLDTSGGFDLQGNITLGDSEKILLGASSDLQIYHDESGGHSRIDDTGTGGLVIRGSQVLLEKYGGGYMINAVADGASELYHSGSKKFETTSTGVTVTGNLAVTAHASVGGNLAVSGDLDITGNINSYNVTDLDVTDKTITLGAGQTEALSGGSGIIIDGSSASILWDETNDVFDINKGLTTTGSLAVGTTSFNNNNKLHVRLGDASLSSTSNQSVAVFENNNNAWITIGSTSTAFAGILFADADDTDIGQLRYDHNDNELQFITNTTQKMVIDSSGNVGIAGTPPSDTNTGYPLLSIGETTAIQGLNDSNESFFGNNAIWKSDNSWEYVKNVRAVQMAFADGDTIFRQAASGTAGNDITWSESMRITNTGNCGIGTDNPSDKFHVKGTGSTGIVTERSGTSSAALIADSVGTALYSQEFYGSTTAVPFRIYSGTAEAMRISSGGNVGIGDNDPPYKLSVSGTGGTRIMVENTDTNWAALDIRAGGNQANYIFFKDDSAERARIQVFDGNEIAFLNGDSPTERMRINAAGGLSINDNVENPLSLNRTTTTTGASYMKFTNGGGNYYIGADSSAGDRIAIGGQAYGFTMTAESGRPLVFATSNIARMAINSSGRVSIGTTNANAGLTVSNGDIRTTSPAFANDANSVSMSYESSSTGGGLAVRGPNGSTHGKLFLSVNEGDGGNGRAGIVIEPGGQVRKQYHPSFLIGTPNPNTAGNVWKSNTIFHNNGSHWNNTTGRFTAPVAGYYFFFHWGMLTAGQTSTDADVYSRLNGTRDQIGTAYSGAQGGNYLIFNATYTRYLNANDYVDVYLSSGTIYNNNDGRHGHFGGYLIG